MATKKKKVAAVTVSEPAKVVEKNEVKMEEGLDPKEEKILDWILKAVVAFVLGWLGLSILLVLGGFFGLWK